jgi:hypothetical protein
VKKRPWMLHTLSAQLLFHPATLLVVLVRLREGPTWAVARVMFIILQIECARGRDPIVRRLSARLALSTSDSRQGLFGNQSVQGSRPRAIVLMSIALMPLSIVAHHRVVISLDCRSCYLGATLTATRQKRDIFRMRCVFVQAVEGRRPFSALGFTFSLPCASAPPYRTTSISLDRQKLRAGPAIAASGCSVNCRPATSVREGENEKTLHPVVLPLMRFKVIDRVLD